MNIPNRLSFASGSNAAFIESLYQDYVNNPDSVDASWRHFFEGYDFAAKGVRFGAEIDADEAKVEALINAYRRLGHLSAHLDPLSPKPQIKESMRPEAHGLANVDPKRLFHPSNLGIKKDTVSFEEILNFLVSTYCGTIGADYRETNDIDAILWLQDQMESCQNRPELSREVRFRILTKLVETEGFEKFLQDRYLGQKRFSIEGLDTMIVLLDTMANEGASAGVEEFGIGMAHRGRLNVLANFLGKPYEAILKEFEGTEFNPNAIEGDVKYHKGYANEITTSNGGKIRVYLSPNPSHLEAVNPVLEGFTRARQRLCNDPERSKILPILIHGDAAVVGQGIVAETLNFANLKAYRTGGTIHIIANNQLGFTAYPDESKSCDYASDIAKMIRAPVLHVNADDPEAVVWCATLAIAYRQKFHKDFVIDLVGYRRFGHNETDEPGFTQPLMYKVIKEHPIVLSLYGKDLVDKSVLTAPEIQAKQKEFRSRLQECQNTVREGNYKTVDSAPAELKVSTCYIPATREDVHASIETGVPVETLKTLAERFCSFPKEFTPHPKIVKLFETRKEMMQGVGSVDWGLAELLAYTSCARDGHHVRLSGQDTGRGTFSHRHAILRDYNDNHMLEILNQIGDGAARIDVINSPLSEQGCMGFEFGYSVADPNSLVLWEAQFGDFVNGAQIIMDQFLVASEAKWKQTSGLVLLLPHGYEGQGPEHSSARPERFLQSCGNENIQVVNCTTPAQIFHVLRRQIMRNFRKPLIIMTPKSLLRHPKVISQLNDFADGRFQETIDDSSDIVASKVERIVLCTGKIYYDLLAAREATKGADKGANIPLIRIEQLYPYPKQKIDEILMRYKTSKELVWTQEEPINMGAWTYIRPCLEEFAQGRLKVKYVGRKGSGSTAEGSPKSHALEQQRIVEEALKIK